MTPFQVLTLPSRDVDIGASAWKVLCLPAPFIILPALMVSAHQKPGERSIPVSISVVRLKRNRLIVACQRLVETLHFMKGGSTVAERVGEVRLKRNRLVVAHQ